MATGVCKLFPDKCKDLKTGKEYDSQLFKDLRAAVDYDSAWVIYLNVTEDASLKEKHPQVTFDNLGQPTFESIKNIDWVSEILQKQSLSTDQALTQLNNQYSIDSTENFTDIADRIGAIERNNSINGKYTAKVIRGKKDKKVVYSLQVVPKNVKNQLALQNFIEQQSYKDRLLTIAAKSGIGIEIIDGLSDDVSGQFDNHNPERVFNNIIRLIKINKNKDILEQTRATCEELGHTIATIYEGNELTKEQYDRFANLCFNNRHLLNDILSKEDLAEIDSSHRMKAEAVGKVLGHVLFESGGKIQRTGNQFTRGTARLFNSTGVFLQKLWQGVKDVFRNSINVLSNNAYFKDQLSEDNVDDVSYAIKQEIQLIAKQMTNSLLDNSIVAEQALKVKQKLNRETKAYSDLAVKVTNAYENFLTIIEKHDMLNTKTLSVLKQHMVNARRQYLTDKQADSILLSKNAEQSYIRSIYQDLAEVLGNIESSFSVLTEDFKEMCMKALEKEDSKYDLLEAAATITCLPEQLKILNKGRLALQLVNDLNDAYLRNKATTNTLQEEAIKEIMTSLDDITDKIKDIYYRFSKGAFVAQMIVANNGQYYIDRGARIMQLEDSTGKRELRSYKGRRIYLSELVEELNPLDGYFDMSWWGKRMQKAGSSIDPITQLLDQMVKTNQFNANQENLRWQKTILDLRERCKELTGSYDTDFIWERDEDGNRTGNIRQRTKWGLWESEFEAEKKYWYDTFKEQYKSELEGMTNLERSQFLLNKFQQHYNQWHKDNSLTFDGSNIEDLPDMFLEEDSNGNLLHIEKRYYESKLAKSRNYRNRAGEDITLNLKDFNDEDIDAIRYSAIKFFPNPSAFGGKYYDSTYDTELTAGQKQFIKEYLELKIQLDSKINRYKSDATVLHRMPQFRGTLFKRLGGDEGIRGALSNKFTESIFADLQDEDFGDISSYNSEEQSFMPGLSHSLKEIRHRIPIFGVNKLRNMEALDTDIFRSMMAYASMANNVECLSTTADTAMLGMDVLQSRSIEGKTERQRFASSANSSNIYYRYEKYVEMAIFGQYASLNTMPFSKNKEIALQKITRGLSKWNSWLLLAGQFTGGNVNTGTGLWQILKESMVGEHFTKKQYAQAMGIYIKYGLDSNINQGIVENMRTNPLYRFIAYMDTQNKNRDKFRDMDTVTNKLLKANWAMCWYENGDHLMQTLPYLMKALNTTLYKRNSDGTYTEVGNMWEVFEKACLEGSFEGNTDTLDSEGETGWGNPLSYEEEIMDENLGDFTKVRRNYYIKSDKAKDEYLSYGITDAEVFENRISELNDERTQKERMLSSIKNNAPATYMDDSQYKRVARELDIINNQIYKYETLLDSGTYNLTDGDFDEFNNIAQAKFQDSCRDLCDNLHGIYNSLDAVEISQSVVGAMALTMKKFYLGYANNAWLSSRDSIAQGHDIEGYGMTLSKVLRWYLFTNGTDRQVDTRVLSYGILSAASIIGSAASLGLYHSIVLSGLSTTLGYVAAKILDNKSFNNKMRKDGFSYAQAMSLSRAFKHLYIQMFLHLYNLLFGFKNYGFTHDPDDDDKSEEENDDLGIIYFDKDGKEVKVDENGKPINENDIIAYKRKRKLSDLSDKEKKIRRKLQYADNMKEKLRRKKAGEDINKKQKQIYHYTDYDLDAKILNSLFGIEDYSDKAYAMSGGRENQKTPGILSTLLLTEKDSDDKYTINKGSREDILGTYKTLCILNYFMRRWEIEQAILSPTYATANAPGLAKEIVDQKGELLAATFPVAMSHTLDVMYKVLDWRTEETKYPHDKNLSFLDFDALKQAENVPEEEVYNSPWIDRILYSFYNCKNTILGNRVAPNYIVTHLIPYGNQPNFFYDPKKSEESFEFQRSAKR